MKHIWILAGLLASGLSAADFSALRAGDELILRFHDLDQQRLRGEPLRAEIDLAGKRTLSVDFADPAQSQALVIDLHDFGSCDALRVLINNQTHTLKPVVAAHAPGMPGPVAAVERGSKWSGDAPRIQVPDTSALRTLKFETPQRVVNLADVTFPVISESDLPVLGSQNMVLLVKERLYFSYRKAVIDSQTLRVKHWRKFLVEVPVHADWALGSGDETLTLSPDQYRIHTSEELAPNGRLMLGAGSGGLAQGGQSGDSDEQGRLYFSNLDQGAALVRFDPAKAKFEQPPVNLGNELAKLLPPDPNWRRSWDTALGELVVARGRVFLVFARNHRVRSPNGSVEVCSGVVSLPQDHWDDAAKFVAGIKLHAGCWEGAPNQLYHGELAAADYTSRKMAAPFETDTGLVIPSATGSKGGPWQLDFDAQGGVSAFREGSPAAAPKLHAGLKKQRFINVGAAGRPLLEFDCGEFRLPRAAVPLMLAKATADTLVDPSRGDARLKVNGGTEGTLTVRFDVTSMTQTQGPAVVQGPAYAITPIPGEPGQALGVCEYGYYFSRLDFSKLESEQRIRRTYLPMPGAGLPAQVGLGPYNTQWLSHDDSLWLYVPGYIGMTRLKYAEHGKVLPAFTSHMFHDELSGRTIDGAHRDSIKDYKELFPALGGRLLDIGRGRPGRGGKAFSTGLELFDPRTLGSSEVAVRMTRCFDIWTPVSRVILSAKDGSMRQQIFVGGSAIRPDYVRDIADPGDLPANHDPKLWSYECDAEGHLRDLFGVALQQPAQLAISRDGQFVLVMRYDAVLMSYCIATQRFVDAVKLDSMPLEFTRPGQTIWPAPNGQVFVMTATNGISFHEVATGQEGRLTLNPHLTIAGAQSAAFEKTVRCFLPDLEHRDGSYDFVIGGRHQGEDPAVRVLRDFIRR
jgi:hypothetical protein